MTGEQQDESRDVDTGGGHYVEGDVRPDGDAVFGNKVVNIGETPSQRLAREQHEAKARRALARKRAFSILVVMLVVAGVGAYLTLRPHFPPEREGEVLVVIATFHHSEGVTDTEIHNKILRGIDSALEESDVDVRVEVEPTVLRAVDREGAEALGEKYNASMVIWGEDTGTEVVVNFLDLKQPEATLGDVELAQSILSRDVYVTFTTEDLPERIGFLSLFGVARSFSLAGDYLSALALLDQNLASLPEGMLAPGELAVVYFQRAGVHYYLNDDALAIADLDQVLALDPTYTAAYNNRGLIYAALEAYQPAIADYGRAIEIDPTYAKAYFNRGNVYRKLDEHLLAIADYGQAIELNPMYAEAYGNRGLAYAALGEYQLAIADYDRVLALNSADSLAYNNRGNAYRDLGEYSLAIADYDRAIELNPAYALAYSNRARAYYDLGQYEEAIADLRYYLELAPDTANRAELEAVIAEMQAELGTPAP